LECTGNEDLVDLATAAEVIAFMKDFPDAKTFLQLWLDKTKSAKWESLTEEVSYENDQQN
jgi:hypothetical protein